MRCNYQLWLSNMKDLYRYEVTVLPEWIDHNGHMNVAYYILAFDMATDAMYEEIGIGEDYPAESGCSVFTLGMDVDYLTEAFTNDQLSITSQVLDWDAKRVHYYHKMTNVKTGALTAVNECLAMNIELDSRRSHPFPESVQGCLANVFAHHRLLKQPGNSMKRLGIRRK